MTRLFGIVDLVHCLGNNTDASLGLELRSTLDMTDTRFEELTTKGRRVFGNLLYKRRARATRSNPRLNRELRKEETLDY